jgi:hypothetical protein
MLFTDDAVAIAVKNACPTGQADPSALWWRPLGLAEILPHIEEEIKVDYAHFSC